jgi:hypothetical protein
MTQTTECMPDVIVDRSPELRRGLAENAGSQDGSFPRGYIEITDEDIGEGQRGDGATCAIARTPSQSFHPQGSEL